MRRRFGLAHLLAALCLTAPAAATQHLVRAGSNWQQLQRRLKPGDEIILMPGRHRPATLDGLRGERDRPIVIRGLDPARPSVIHAARFGIRLIDPRHVQLRDLSVRGATIHGILIEGRTNVDALPGPIVLTRVTITDTGPIGSATVDSRHALSIRHMRGVSIRSCHIEGWSGSAIEVVGGREISIRDCTFVGHDDRHQVTGVRLRAGCRGVGIDRCRFTNVGDQGICVGGASQPDEFHPRLAEEDEPDSLFEASRVTITRSTFLGGLCAVAFVNCTKAIVRRCTIVRPRRAVVSIRRDQQDPRFAAPRRCAFGGNLVIWEPGDLTSLTHLGPGADISSVVLEENLWWTPGGPAAIKALGAFPGTFSTPQIVDVDPALDATLRPVTAAAGHFGAN